MKITPIPMAAAPTTLQDVIDGLAENEQLSVTRKRDLRSAVVSLAKLAGRPAATIPLNLDIVRELLDEPTPAAARVSAKRWANMRSDLVAAIKASELRPMLKTAGIDLGNDWSKLLEGVTDKRICNGLSRFARWATLRGIAPQVVNDASIGSFIAELETSSLVRNVSTQHRSVAKSWNMLVGVRPDEGLGVVQGLTTKATPSRISWEQLSGSFRDDVDRYLTWTAVPDPLDDGARARALAPKTRNLRRDQIHSAVTAAAAAGIDIAALTSLASLVAPETYKVLLRQRWNEDGQRLSAYTHGIAGTLIAVAVEWVKAPAATIATLKVLRRRLGTLPSGLTQKNQALLRKFEDPRLLRQLVDLPDQLWRRARRDLATARRPFVDLQNALAIDLLTHVPLRMENLSSLNFERHLHWPQGRGKPALIVFDVEETKNYLKLEYEIPTVLADRLLTYRNEIAPTVTGARPDAVFVTWAGAPRTQSAITVAVEKAIARHLGVKVTPHQFRHLVAKIILDQNPGAYELVRQMLGHKNLKTTTNFYAGIDTRRAGRAHADLLMKIRETGLHQKPRHTRSMKGR